MSKMVRIHPLIREIFKGDDNKVAAVVAETQQENKQAAFFKGCLKQFYILVFISVHNTLKFTGLTHTCLTTHMSWV